MFKVSPLVNATWHINSHIKQNFSTLSFLTHSSYNDTARVSESGRRCSCCGSSLKKKNSKENPTLELLTKGFYPHYTLVGYYINSNTDPQNLAEDKSQIHTFMFGGLVLLGLSCALFRGDVTTSVEIFIEGVKKKLTVRQWIRRFDWFNYLISPNWYSVQETGLFNWSSCFQNQIKN